MATFRCRARKHVGEIDAGYEIQVCTTSWSLTQADLKKALERLGFNKTTISHFSTPFNWEVTKVG